MTGFPRYAIYFVPAPDSDIYRFGAAILGYDAFTGHLLPFADGLTATFADWHDLTRDPRKYGFHATLKAPFSLASGVEEAGLIAACAEFCASARDVPTIQLVVRSISDFVAIVPEQPAPALNRLAKDCVEAFDRCRAPLTAEDRARRNPERLTPRQVEHLDRWGYPYVLDDFRFHMTLSGRIPAERRETVRTMLRERFVVLEQPALSIDRIAVFRQDDTRSSFRIISHYPLRPSPVF